MAHWEDMRSESMTKCILPLSNDAHKGTSGRIGVLGGSDQYTGAPYYAALASLHAGADLCFIFTAAEATLPLKIYSPEFMVQTVYTASVFHELVEKDEMDTENAQKLVEKMVKQVTDSMDKLHALVIGPGMGRCPLVMRAVAQIIKNAMENQLSLVLDADALYLLSLDEYRDLLRGYERAVLTPNVVEYQRLFGDDNDSRESFNLANVTVIRKGQTDLILQGSKEVYQCTEEGGLKRSGGIGDILAGTTGTLVAWYGIQQESKETANLALSCWTACCIVKRATKIAFGKKRRAMTAPNVLDALGPAMDEMTSE